MFTQFLKLQDRAEFFESWYDEDVLKEIQKASRLVVTSVTKEKLPIKHIAVERQITINHRKFRFDILVFDKKGNPSLIIECKSHKIKLTEETAIQVSKYNLSLKAKHLCITNGIKTMFSFLMRLTTI